MSKDNSLQPQPFQATTAYAGKGVDLIGRGIAALNNAKINDRNVMASIFYKRGLDYFQALNGKPQDYIEAFRSFEMAELFGSVEAKYFIGLMYESGFGVEKSNEQAISCFRQSAADGFPLSQIIMYKKTLTGAGLKQSFEEASYWCEKLALSGYVKYQYRFGALILKGKFAPKQLSLAAKWLRQACFGFKRPFPPAAIRLGEMYLTGRGVEKDYQEAIRLFKLSVDPETGWPSLAKIIRSLLIQHNVKI